jgi:GDP-L-fucose synthase
MAALARAEMTKDSLIYVAGHRGLVGSAVERRLRAEGYTRLVTRTRAQLDLTSQAAVERFFKRERPEYVFLCAAKVGGILANASKPADFIRDNLLIQTLALDAALHHSVRKLVFLGSSCVYPKFAPQPIQEGSLLTAALEPTNEWYAVAKIGGIKMAQAFRRQHGLNAISLMPANVYGPGDNFDLESAHVVPALMRKFHEAAASNAPVVTVWGTGTPRREFLHVDDLADACLFLMLHYEGEEIINVGVGEDVSIGELAALLREIVAYRGEIVYDRSKPDGMPRKLLDVTRARAMGWRPKISLRDGLERTYAWFRNHAPSAKRP